MNTLNNNIDNVKTGYREGITNAVWLDDKKQLSAILSGVNAWPDINYVEVRIGSDVYASSGKKMTQDIIKSSFLLHYEYDNKLLAIGETVVEANLAAIYGHLVNRLWVLLGSNAIKTFFVALFMYFLFDRLVFRRLGQIFEFARHHDIQNLTSRIDVDKIRGHKTDDEISLIANALNEMQEHLSASLNELLSVKTTLDLSPDTILMCYPGSYQFFYANTGAVKLLGYSAEELLEMTPLDICPDLNVASFNRLLSLESEDTEKAIRFESRFVDKNGGFIPVQLILQYLDPQDEAYRFVFIARDISERKKNELMLLKSLEDANAANEAKSKFMMSMSHELRTPLNAIIGFSQLLEFDAYSLTPDQNMAVKDIHHGGKHLLKLVDDILDLSKVESDNIALSFDVMDPVSLIHECVKSVATMAEMKAIRLDNEIVDVLLPKIKIDKTRFKQILINLLSNAIKYNEKEGVVKLSYELRENALIRFKISDTGYGIKLAQQSNVFTAFNRLGHEGSEIDGTGIGLNLTKRLVELMGGVIGFESTEGKGSEFWIDFFYQ
ncbi:MAG: ATP-binding protein [Gammaproteobacteria bacterium]|nr:ATP-binding protein [Gammaproteobacteria bacterium]